MIRNLKTQQFDFGRIQPKKIEINGVEVKPNENGQFTEYYFEKNGFEVFFSKNTIMKDCEFGHTFRGRTCKQLQ